MSTGNLHKEIQRAGIGVTRLVSANLADSAAIGASTTAETDFDKNAVLKGSILQPGNTLRLRGEIIHTGSNTGASLTIRVYIAGEVVATAAFTIAAANDMIIFDAVTVLRAVGQEGSLAGYAQFVSKLNAAVASQLYNKSAATEDLTGDLTVKVSGQYNSANANNTAVLKHLLVELAQ